MLWFSGDPAEKSVLFFAAGWRRALATRDLWKTSPGGVGYYVTLGEELNGGKACSFRPARAADCRIAAAGL